MFCSQTVFLGKLSIAELHVFLLKYFQRFKFVFNLVSYFVHTMSPYAFCLTLVMLRSSEIQNNS